MTKTNEETLVIDIDEFINEWYDKQDYMLVDIREQDEIESDGGVKNAFHISMYDIPDKIEMTPTYITLIALCRTGNRAEQVAKYVRNSGYNNAFYMPGGIEVLFDKLPQLKV